MNCAFIPTRKEVKMKKHIKAFLVLAVIFFAWNIAVKNGKAATNSMANAEEIKNYEGFYRVPEFTKKDLLDNNTYGKYYKLTFPLSGELNLESYGNKLSLLDKNGILIDEIDENTGDYESARIEKYLNAGTYYLLVESKELDGYKHFNGMFNNVFLEKESNNTMATANDITKYTVGKFLYDPEVKGTYEGKVGSDVDYFKFTVNLSAKVNIAHWGADSEISLLDARGKEVNVDPSIEYYSENGSSEEATRKDIFLNTYLSAGTYYIKLQNTSNKYGSSYQLNFDIHKDVPAVKASDVKITNNLNKDTVTIKNLRVGWQYTIYKEVVTFDVGYKAIRTFTATKTTETIEFDQLGKESGSIFIDAYDNENDWSELTEVKYDAESLAKTPAISASNVTITNNFNYTKDVITLKNLVKGATYTIYKDASKKTKLTSFKAEGKTKTVNVKQLGAKAGLIYITVTKPKYSESAPTKVSYKAEKLPAVVAKNVTITNNIGNDKLELKGLTKGYKYTIYTDTSLKKKLTHFTATGTTKTLSVKQVGAKAGAVYVVASKSGYTSSSATKVSYKGQPTAALSSKNVKVINAKSKDTIKLSGLKKGTTYVIYKDAKKKTKLASFKATDTIKTVTVKQLGTSAGKIYITAQAVGYNVSALTTVSYSKQK